MDKNIKTKGKMKTIIMLGLLISTTVTAQISPAPSFITAFPKPMVGPLLETINTNGLVVGTAGPVINLGADGPVINLGAAKPVLVVPTKPVCKLFDIWGNSGVCNRFPSHVEAEQHYEASLFTIKELNSKLDVCRNDLVECTNDAVLPPIPVPIATPVPPSGTEVPGCNVIANASERRFIYKQSAPLRASGIGTPIIGFRKEPTLIMNTDISSKGIISILDGKGASIARCPWASASGHAGGRARCSVQTSAVRQAAIKNTGSPTIYFKVSPELCVRVPDAGRCVNSVKGLCTDLIE